ncbi:hypothetical protein IPJ72_01480 [Candidatus Peregrinibacteria bacterium]|nr:MAG: hypothetical protein IPJ72_01480 [Candidatus Peregrinibacteria bacterium]
MDDLIKKYENHQVDEKTQQMLNQAATDDTGFNEGHEEFLKKLIEQLKSGQVNPLEPTSLYNHAVYDQLSEEDQEKADLTAVNLVSIIRQIEKLWALDQKATFQIQNLVETVFQMKSKFEQEYGDVYVI